MTKRNPFALFLAGVALCLTGYAVWLVLPSAGPTEWAITAGVGIAGVLTLVGVARPRLRLQSIVAGGLLLYMVAFIVANLSGLRLVEYDPFPEPRYAVFLSALLGLTVVGLSLRWFVARWIAMALAAAGVVSAGLNLVPWVFTQNNYSWMLVIHIAGAILVCANLFGADMRSRFEVGASEIWTSTEPMLRTLRWTILCHFAAIPMLLVYSWMQPIVPATATPAMLLAAFLAASVALAVLRKVVGAIGLVLGGTGLLVHTATTLLAAFDQSSRAGDIALYYAVFWVPAGVSAVVCGACMAGPVLRLLRR